MSPLNDRMKEKFHRLVELEEPNTDWEPLISIGTAAKMVKLSPSALRKYEKEGLLIFYRTESGRRLLSMADLKRLRMIQKMIKGVGLNMEGIRRLLALLPCWQIKPCQNGCDYETNCSCEAHTNTSVPCWMLENKGCGHDKQQCRDCSVYRYGAYATDIMKELLLN